MKIQEIYELMNRFEEASMTELELEMEGVRVAFKKEGQKACAQSTDAKKPSASEEKGPEHTSTAVEAPLVGTFYSAPAPEEPDFVKEGQQVKKGDVVGIIEAMKLMNEITAPCDGQIESIHVENGQTVEYGQVLMRVK